MKIRNLLFAVLALLASLPVVADNEFTDANGNVWTYEYVDPDDPSQGVNLTSSSVEGNVLPLEISVGDVTLPVIGIGITLEDGMTSIPDGFFKDNTRLTSIIIPNTVTSIGEGAFCGCTSLTSVVIPNSVTSIGKDAFGGSGLTSVTISNSITSISDGTFHSCPLTSVDIPEGVVSIGNDVFWGCQELVSVTIPNTVTCIGDYSFNYCRSLSSITIPESVMNIGVDAFTACSPTSIIVDERNSVYDSRDNCNAIIETASNTLLFGCRNTIIPATVTNIGDAFQKAGLTSIYIPESVVGISQNAFLENYPTSIVVAEGNSVYDSRDNCNAIIETASNTLFRGCQNTIIPSSVTSIGKMAFYTSDLHSMTIPSSIKSIGDYAFYYNSLSSATIPEGVVYIGDQAFGLNPLTSITIPSTVTHIGEGAFAYSGGFLESIMVSEENTKYDSRNNCNALIETESNTLLYGCRNTIIPSSVTHIGGVAFWGCPFTSITNDPSQASETCLYIPSSVTSMGGGFTEVTTVTLPEGLTELLEGSFGENVTTLVSTKTIPFVLENPNIGVALNCVLHIPAGTKDAYIAAGWTEEVFGGGIVEDGEGAPESVSVTLGSLGAGTFCSKYNLDFSGTEDVKAYIVSAFMPSTGEVTLTRIKYVPALTGVVLLGDEGTYDIPLTDKQIMVANMLVGVTERTKLNRTEGRYTNFILANGSGGLGFYTTTDGSTLAAGRAYLPLLTNQLPASAPNLTIRFDDGDATSIDEMEADNAAAIWHDLSGRTLDKQPTAKGVYIVNGKKIIVK